MHPKVLVGQCLLHVYQPSIVRGRLSAVKCLRSRRLDQLRFRSVVVVRTACRFPASSVMFKRIKYVMD
jgi:hypothetical protein